MNKAYRLVWSECQDRFIAVPEFARSHSKSGKGGERLLLAALTLSALFMSPVWAQGVVVSGGTTAVYNAANGVPVVAIAAGNAAGLSHNKYDKFNVDSQGLVLNNNAAAGAVQSQLAGAIVQNTNLSAAARLILNEVVTNNRSALKGYMEVAGSRANVVVANPWGITCNGCGFINTDRATLSTGVPVFAGDGSLERLRVSDGDIRVEGAGLQGQGANVLDLVARSLVVDGQIRANDLQLIAGSNDYNYTQRSATAIAASGAEPSYAIDSTALGGMYAQKIALIATEQGVGVRMLGDAAASASDFTLTADKMIELNAKSISAKGNLAVTSTTAAILVAPGAALSAGASLSLNADNRIDSYGTLKASGVLSVKASSLINQGYIGSGEGFRFDVWRLENGSTSNYSARIESTQDRGNSTNASSIVASSDVINYGAIHAADDLSINAKIIQNQSTGGITSGRALNLTAANTIENRGALYSGDRGVKLQAPTITNYTGGTIEAVTGISAKSSVFNNYSVIRADTITVNTDTSFYNGLETAITPVLDMSKTVSSAASEPLTQIDFWQEAGCVACNERTLFQDTVTYREQYSSPLPAVKPQMLALGTLRLEYGEGTATNYAGVLSGDLVSITGSGTFTNQDVSLAEVTYYRRALDYKQNGWAWINASHAYLAATTAIPLTNANISDAERKRLSSYASVPDALGHSALFEKNRVSYTSTGAGVYANTLYVSAEQVKNIGAPFSYGDSRLAQGGFSVTLPTNPNGHYVLSGDPKSRYLVVTNPDFVSKAASANSYELEKLMGYSPDDALLRVGDSDYEDSLVRQQLIAANASQLLAGNDLEEINRLRGNAVAEFRAQKLTYGEALTPQQIKGLSRDIVWMEKTKVGGKEVLVPRVYLSASTQAMLTGGAVLAAKNTTIYADSVTNRGATIAGTQNLAIKTTGNITNESGTISGGSVNLAATGSIENKTLTQAQGNSRTFKTTLGNTARIEATTGSLEISAGQQIQSRGGEIKAAQDATLTAVGAIALDSIENKNTISASVTNSTKNKKSKKNTKASDNKTQTTIVNVGSSLVAGKQLKVISGADVTFKGSEVNAGGNSYIQNKGDVKILADQNKTMTHSESKNSGRGVNGARWGKKKQTSDETKSINSGSSLAAAGDGTVNTTGALTVQGSQVKTGGDAKLTAGQGIAVLAGKNEVTRTTRTQTTSFLKRGGDTPPTASVDKPTASTQTGDVQASAKAAVGAQAAGKAGFTLYGQNSTTQKSTDTINVGSAITSGGKLDAGTDKTLIVQGSGLSSGQTMNLQAGDLKVITGTNTTQSSSTTSGFALGAFADGGAKASTDAQAQARASHGAAASAGASAKASAEGTLTLGFQKTDEKKGESTLTHTGSTLNSGGDMKLGAQGTATFSGSEVNSGGNLALSGQNIVNTAAQDTTQKSTSTNSHLFGINYAGVAKVEAAANAGAQTGIGAGVEASAKVEASVSGTAGVRYKNEQEKTTTDTVTQRTNAFTAQKDIKRTASDTLSDQGTRMTAGGDIAQSARLITDQAVTNSTKTNSDTQKHDVRLGLHAGASAEAGAAASAATGPSDASAKASAKAGVGFQASYQREAAKQDAKTTTAVTSAYTAGGGVSSTSSGTTSLEGTQITAGKDVILQARELKVGAAKDTSSSSSNTQSTDVKLTGTIVGTAGVAANVSHKDKTGQAESATERAGAIKAGGNVTASSGGDATFTGTQISSQGKTTLDAKGDVKLEAARNTSNSSTQSVNGNVGIDAGKSSGAVSVGVTYGKGTTSSTTGQGAQIDGKGGVVVTAGKGATLEGTQLSSQGDVTIAAKDQVRLLETTKTEKTTTLGVGVGFKGKTPKQTETPSAPKPTTEPSGAEPTKVTKKDPRFDGKPVERPTTGLNVNDRKTEATTSTATTIDAGYINIKGGSVQDQGAQTLGQTIIEGHVEKKEQTDKRSMKGFELILGSPSKKAE